MTRTWSVLQEQWLGFLDNIVYIWIAINNCDSQLLIAHVLTICEYGIACTMRTTPVHVLCALYVLFTMIAEWGSIENLQLIHIWYG